MNRTNRLLVIFNTLLATILVLVLIQFAPSVANADSTTIVACANKKTGALRIAYKKCTKNENKVTWGKKGPQGATGATGEQGAAGLDLTGGAVVKDATGTKVSNVIQIDAMNGKFSSLVGNYIWNFSLTTGLPIVNGNDYLIFKNSICTGENILGVYGNETEVTDFYYPAKILSFTKVGGGSGFYKLTSTTPVAITGFTHYINDLGVCSSFTPIDDKFGIYGFTGTEVTSIPSLPAPLTISGN
jgi:hypothetical protein